MCCAASALAQDSKVKVACVGNSITFGYLLPDPDTQSYPAQLQQMLGDGYVVGNFGKSGATLLRQGHRPYNQQEEYAQAMDFAGDIAIIHLGVNDTDPRDWPKYRDSFVSDYLTLIDDLKRANPGCRVIISRLTPITSLHKHFEAGRRDWRKEISAAVETVAQTAQVELIDFDTALSPYPWLLHDAVHPTAEGAAILAKTAYSAITGDYGGLKMPAIFTDSMVLQRDNPLKIHGTANAGATVTVTIAAQTATATANNRGQWSVTLLPLPAGGPYELKVSDGHTTLTYSDILAGEVWLCSGQSNMQYALKETLNADSVIAASANNQIRLYNMRARWRTNVVEWETSALDSVNWLHYFANTQWQSASPETTPQFSAVAYYFGKMLQDSLGVPIGLICNAIGGSPAESWIDRETLETGYPAILKDWKSNHIIQDWVRERASKNITKATNPLQRHPYLPAYLYDAGIRPLEQFPIKGVIWYQGESNEHNPDAHERLFKLLVESWRGNWGDCRMPFYFAQLSSISRPSWPWFRDGQRRLMRQIPNTGMAVTSDHGDSLDVHPKNKQPVGERLARWALYKTYNMTHVTPSGPLLSAAQFRDGAVYIDFTYGEGLHSSDGGPIGTFEVAEIDGIFYPATATVVADGRIMVSCDEVRNPRYVRYAWQPFTRANLVNSDGLPASTFRAEAGHTPVQAAAVDVVQGFPDDDSGFAKGVSACVAGTTAGKLIIAGGCNFPDKPASQGGKKIFYDAIYAADISADTSLTWSRIGTLPEPMAYAVAVSTSLGIVCAGGCNSDGALTDVFRITLNDGKAAIETLPPLPAAIDNAAGCVAGNTLYIAGGNLAGKPSNALYALDLGDTQAGWRRLPDFPGNPRTQPVCAALSDADGNTQICLWGGFAGKDESRDASLEVDGRAYSPATGTWAPLPAPTDTDGQTLSLGGGAAVAWSDNVALCAGGVNKDIFLAALQNQAPDYMTHPAEWYRFNTLLTAYDALSGSWSVIADTQHLARAGAALVPANGCIFCVNGELKPGVRTPQITRISLKN